MQETDGHKAYKVLRPAVLQMRGRSQIRWRGPDCTGFLHRSPGETRLMGVRG